QHSHVSTPNCKIRTSTVTKTMNQNRGRGGFGFGGLTPIVSGLASGIGLASEGIHHYREKKAAKKSGMNLEETSISRAYDEKPKVAELPGQSKFEEGDEEQWDLDDAQDELIAELPTEHKRERDPKKITENFIGRYPAPQGYAAPKLPLPVILPQRRPKDRARGFIRAYAPDLATCGIDQDMFLDFLNTFNEAS